MQSGEDGGDALARDNNNLHSTDGQDDITAVDAPLASGLHLSQPSQGLTNTASDLRAVAHYSN